MLRNAVIVAAAMTVILVGCATRPAYQRPAAELPPAWTDMPTQGQAATGDRWWSIYRDPALDTLVEEALANNRHLAIAAARVEEARAVLSITDAQRAPSVDVTAERARSRSSARSSIPLPPGVPLERNVNRAAVNVAYELDLWGRLSGATAAVRAELLASEAARGTVRIALVSQTIQSYVELIALDMQIEATLRALDVRGQNLNLQRKRYDAGLIADFNLRQLEAELATARAQLPLLQQRRTAQDVALSVLLGRSPRSIVDNTIIARSDESESPLAVIPSGLPSDLLLRRPDIVEAEQRLVAANARIGVARASLFSRIALTGFSAPSASLGDLFSAPARIWELAFGLAQPIFQGGRLRAEIAAVEARERQAVAFYQRTLQVAFGEVREALSGQTRFREVYLAESDRVAALSETLRLARIRFDNGLSSRLEVLDAERNLLQAELNRIDALRAQRAAVADVVRALGGGWTGLPRDEG